MNVAPVLPIETARPTAQSALLQVSAIGSCRVTNPLRRGRASDGFQLNQSGIYGYVHSSSEALQQISVMQGDATIPAWLEPVIAPNLSTAGTHQESDFYVLELSSAKLLTVDNTYVQLNYLTAYFRDLFKDATFSREYWQMTRAGATGSRKRLLDEAPALKDRPDSDRAILEELQLASTTPASMEADLLAIRDRVPDLMLVSHFRAGEAAAAIRSRRNFVEMVHEVAGDLAIQIFDPTDWVEAFGIHAALAEDGASATHYSEEFEAFLLDHWTNRYIGPRAHLRETRPDQARVSRAVSV